MGELLCSVSGREGDNRARLTVERERPDDDEGEGYDTGTHRVELVIRQSFGCGADYCTYPPPQLGTTGRSQETETVPA